MGAWPGMEPPECRARRKLLLRSASFAALVHRQYRGPSRPSHEQPDPLLPAAPGSQRSSGIEKCRAIDAVGQLPDSSLGALVRNPQETRAVQRDARTWSPGPPRGMTIAGLTSKAAPTNNMQYLSVRMGL